MLDSPVVVRSAFDGLNKKYSDESGTDFTPIKDAKGKVLNPGVLSMTRQSDAAGTDINEIVAAARKNGGVIMGVSGTPIYMDFSDLGDYRDISTRVAQANQSFQLVPADIRNRFDNDLAKFYDWLADPKNVDEAIKLKLMPPLPGAPKATTDDARAKVVAQEPVQDAAAKAAASVPPGTVIPA